jgi:hypothetical protein
MKIEVRKTMNYEDYESILYSWIFVGTVGLWFVVCGTEATWRLAVGDWTSGETLSLPGVGSTRLLEPPKCIVSSISRARRRKASQVLEHYKTQVFGCQPSVTKNGKKQIHEGAVCPSCSLPDVQSKHLWQIMLARLTINICIAVLP